ncbi:MAG: hypothetical protein K0R50_2757 [Eubacterium sp.]|nr:hypothetical protein [Eubacterium sp.]
MKKSISILLISLFIFSLAACGSKNTSAAAADSSVGGRMQVQAADLTGEVSSVSDNKITLKVIKMPALGRNGRAPSDNSNSSPDRRSSKNTQRTFKFTGETKTVTLPGDIEITSAGRRQSEDSADEQPTLNISDIKQGDVLQIWYSKNDGEAISRVVLMESMPGLSGSNDDHKNSENITGK